MNPTRFTHPSRISGDNNPRIIKILRVLSVIIGLLFIQPIAAQNTFDIDIEIGLDGGVLFTEIIQLKLAEKAPTPRRHLLPAGYEPFAVEVLHLEHNGNTLLSRQSGTDSGIRLARSDYLPAGEHRFQLRYFIPGLTNEGMFGSNLEWSFNPVLKDLYLGRVGCRLTLPVAVDSLDLAVEASAGAGVFDKHFDKKNNILMSWSDNKRLRAAAFRIMWPNGYINMNESAEQRRWFEPSPWYLWCAFAGTLVAIAGTRFKPTHKPPVYGTTRALLWLLGLTMFWLGGLGTTARALDFNVLFLSAIGLGLCFSARRYWLRGNRMDIARWAGLLGLALAVSYIFATTVSWWYPIALMVLYLDATRFTRPLLTRWRFQH